MDWKKPRFELQLLTSDINYMGRSTIGNSDWPKIRTATLNRRKNICRFCGGGYTKYMVCFHLDDDPFNNKKDNLDISCKLCYVLTHVNFGHIDDVILCHSSLSQLDIVRKTIDHIIKNKKTPTPSEIDDKVKYIPVSLMELCSIMINNNGSLPSELSTYKLFVTNSFDTSFVDYHQSASQSAGKPYLFTESDDEEENNNIVIPIEDTLPLYKIHNKEKDVIDKILDINNNLSTCKQMKNELSYILDINDKTLPSQTTLNASPTMISKLLDHNIQNL